ncbi:hypothetical protein DM860_005089 [Cuscuta australis]|uniref:TPX2 C-terminal domain-containing protein n=1 Tax=Cuscuta australis TaxID=267555 RepID=A0A328DNH7_9ASTE|nr:hypothetical protein DM860_005089 [Cuscuta australis]
MESFSESSGFCHCNPATENSNPNVTNSGLKESSSPSSRKPARRTQKSGSKNPRSNPSSVVSHSTQKSASKIRSVNSTPAPSPQIRKLDLKIQNPVVLSSPQEKEGEHECVRAAADSIGISRDGYFENHGASIEGEIMLEEFKQGPDAHEVFDERAVSSIKRSREGLLDSGRVLHLVQAFEKLLLREKPNGADEEQEQNQQTEDLAKREFSPPDIILTHERLGLESPCSSLINSIQVCTLRSSAGDRRSRRKSVGSARRHCKRKQMKPISQEPFKLRTELRGKCKEEKFFTKIKQMMEEEERQRVPIAQGLPCTTDAPECLVKPHVKDSTKSIDVVLHSDVRAVERAEFDHQVAEKLNLIEQYKAERERQRMLAEEDRIRRLRKELIPKAHPLPYFDRPFIPQRSQRQPTMPKEPKFHVQPKQR